MTNSKTMLEKELQEVITLTSTELEEYQEKVLELEDEVSDGRFVSDCVTTFRFLCRTLIFINYLNLFHSFKSPDASRSESES